MDGTTTKEDVRIDKDDADELNREAAEDLERIENEVKREAEQYVEAVDGDGNEKESVEAAATAFDFDRDGRAAYQDHRRSRRSVARKRYLYLKGTIMVDRAYKTGDASVDMKNGAKDMGHDVKNNMKDAYHEAKAGMNERKAEDAAAKREHEEAQRTGDPAAAMRAQQHEQRKDEKGEGFMESVKESIGKAGEAIKDAAVDAKDNVKQGVENIREGR